MFENVEVASSVDAALTRLRDAVDDLIGLDLARLGGDELLALLRGVEAQRRRLPVADHRLVAELDARGVAGELCARDTKTLLREVLRLSPGEAKRRCAAAVDLGPRRTVTGEALPPIFPAVAAAQADGAISPEHARIVTDAVDRLPAEIALEHGSAVEARLVADAQRFDPHALAVLARRVAAHLDPDGVLVDDAEHERRRHATLTGNKDGSGELHAHLTPAALAQWQSVLDPLAAPCPAEDGTQDPRGPGQRLHDALAESARRLLASGTLPAAGGLPATVLLTVTLDQLESRTGLVTTAHGGTAHGGTAHGGTVSVAAALRLAGEAAVVPVVIGVEGVLGCGLERRVASLGQRLALAARDGGCCFPGCDAPPGWTEAHHILEWAKGGGTDLANMCLLCGYHHREFEHRGWRVVMRDGRPWWIPPAWIDPDREPIRNTVHDNRPE